MNALVRLPGESTGWIVLRCCGTKTLKLADSLQAHGYRTWTPVEKVVNRVGEKRSRQRDVAPMMASYVFAQLGDLLDLLSISQSPISPHPAFTVFKYLDRYPVISDRALDPLRVVEQKRGPTDKTPRFTPGDMVKLTEGGFAGLTGVVELTKGKFTMVTFPGFSMPIEINTLYLLSEHPEAIAKAA